MPVVYLGLTNGDSVTVTQDVTDPTTKVLRQLIALGAAVTQSNGIGPLIGRDRHPTEISSLTSFTSSKGGSNAFRYRNLIASASPTTSSRAGNVSYVPSVAPPVGSLSISNMPIKNGRLPKGRSHFIDFVVTGRKLLHLKAHLTFHDPKGKEVLQKTYQLLPGGAVENQRITNPDGTDTISGNFLLLPKETDLPQFTAPETELFYTFDLTNNYTITHLIEKGVIVFYLPC